MQDRSNDKGTRGQGDKETRGQGDKGIRENAALYLPTSDFCLLSAHTNISKGFR
jgi:hypothetical protein